MARTSTTIAEPPQIKAAALRTFHTRLLAWYETHGRHDLPWRTTRDPYAIWVSEIMLQQTQVATVLARFYQPFLDRFPSVEALAAAPREQVMKAWEGLGYYRRAGFLHDASKQLIDPLPLGKGRAKPGVRASRHDHADIHKPSPSPLSRVPSLFHRERVAIPSSMEQLLTLPGIGKNTAHAILAFAYHQPVAILEANVKRIVARVFAWEKPSDAQLWAGAELLLNRMQPFHHNQAMMDLGSAICTPRAPRCSQCPARGLCQGRASPETYPTKKPHKATPVRHMCITVERDAAGKLYLEKRGDALLGGLYGFPQDAVTPANTRFTHKHVAAGCATPAQPKSQIPHPAACVLGSITHAYSHFTLVGQVQLQDHPRIMNSPNWFTRAEIHTLPLSRADHKVLALVDNSHSTKQKRAPAKKQRRQR